MKLAVVNEGVCPDAILTQIRDDKDKAIQEMISAGFPKLICAVHEQIIAKDVYMLYAGNLRHHTIEFVLMYLQGICSCRYVFAHICNHICSYLHLFAVANTYL